LLLADKMPDVIGLCFNEASDCLKATGLEFKIKITSPTSDMIHPYEKKRVVRQKKVSPQLIELVLASESNLNLAKGGGNGGI